MKKLMYCAVIALIATACGTSSQVANKSSNNAPKRVKIEKEECQKEAEASSDFLRGYGIGTSADQMMARDLAALAARNEIVNSVQVVAANMIEKYNQQHSSATSGEMTREDKGKAEQMIASIAEETLQGARVICSNTYKVGNEYEHHVCVELTNVDFTQKAHNKLTSDEKLMIDYEAEKFKKDFKEELEAYRKRKEQGL
ncbi:hypothetical protein L3073_09460 [Ancylomarina sp. DW003]|nr:hypothetical protein [Ancylomarina sp. DW003]MDE5422432.1 hypothetical protein [Ancylomarina sp. DW003]